MMPGQLLEQYKKLPNALESDDISDGPTWWGWVSRGEWEFIYALSFAMEGAGLLPRGARDLHAVMRAAGRYIEERGFRFRGLRFTENDRVERRHHGLIEPRNILFFAMLQRGKVPDYVTHFARAVFMCDNRFKDANLRDMLRAAQADLEATLETMPKAPRDFKDAVQQRVARLKEFAQKVGLDLSSPAALEGLMRMDSETMTLEEELDE